MPSSPTMNHPLLVLWVSVFIISILSPSSVFADSENKQYTNCSSSFTCGVVSNVGFPFWGYNRADYCGLPDFQLDCENNVAKLIVNSVTYRILDFNFKQQTLTVARDDYWSTICPTQNKNNTIDGSSFNYASGLQYLALLYDCINTFNPSGLFETTACQSGTSTQNVYYGNESSSTNLGGVCDVVIIPIFETYSSKLFSNPTNLGDVIDDGFGLQWSDVDNDNCQKCVDKGGECGYSDSKFACYCKKGPCPVSGPSPKRRKLIIAIGASAGIVGMMAILWIVFICKRNTYFKSRQKQVSMARGKFNDNQIETFMKTYGTLAPRRYTYSEVKRMTKSFTSKIGEGGYGIVYKAIMPDARVVAIKVISETKGTGEEFINEVASISRTSHVNIVSLLGFCYEKNKRALIYEFMPNGSLDKFIFKPNSSSAFCSLEWLKMYQISIGIARGLEYLHRGCNTRILHLDIKPQNILLDEEFCPKISDFGLAKICQKKESIVSILGTRGTIGYIAPEVFSRTYGGVSYKSDVYSYGMLVLEMIGARKNYESEGSHSSEMYFPDWIFKELEHSNDVVTGNVSINEEEKEVIRKMTMVSLWCIQTNPTDRPSMNKVVEMLEGGIESLPFPPKPYLHSPPRAHLQLQNESYSSSLLDSNSRITQTE